MSLINSLFAGVSGLRNHQSMMDVIGNNIANVNSIGFKGSRVTFSDTFNQLVKAGTNPTEASGGTNAFQIGLGMKVNSIDRNWNQGTFERTGIVTDLALQGDGMFILKSDNQFYYSRAGAFIFDASGNLVNPQNGAIVQGKVANLGVLPSGNSVQDIKIDQNERLPAIATGQAVWGGNLSSSSTLTRTEDVVQGGAITAAGANNVETTIYDEDGAAYTMTTHYTAGAANTYTVTYDITDSEGNNLVTAEPLGGAGNNTAVFDGTTGELLTLDGAAPAPVQITVSGTTLDFDLDISGVTQGTSSVTLNSSADDDREANIVNGTVTIFDSLGNSHSLTISYTKTGDNTWKWNASVPEASGTLESNSGSITFGSDGSITSPTTSPIITFNPTSGAETGQLITLDFGAGLDGIVQTSSTSNISARSQDGAASATLSNLNIDQYGNVVGVFSNGYSRTLAQIMVATFNNLNGLIGVGDNMYSVSANSGDPYISGLGEDSGTTLQSGALEQSNVDLSEEFTKMIVSQRGFQANARVITTADTLLQEITNLIR